MKIAGGVAFVTSPDNSFGQSANGAALIRNAGRLVRCLRARLIRTLGYIASKLTYWCSGVGRNTMSMIYVTALYFSIASSLESRIGFLKDKSESVD